MQKTSINIQPVKNSSEYHNQRVKPLDYVRTDLAENNASKIVDTISNRLEEIKEKYHKSVGQKMQKKATPIREGVVVIEEETSLDDLQKFADRCEEEFGIKAFQFYIHKDEGHWKEKKWKPNLHAHIVFDWTDEKGKSRKLNPKDMARMQTILAESLGMARGISSDRKHLSAQQFKTEAKLSDLSKDVAEKEELVAELRESLEKLKKQQITRATYNRVMGKIYNAFGKTKDEKQIEELKREKKELEETRNKALEANSELFSGAKKIFEEKQELEKTNKKANDALIKQKESTQKYVNNAYSVWNDLKILKKKGVISDKDLQGLDGIEELNKICTIWENRRDLKCKFKTPRTTKRDKNTHKTTRKIICRPNI